MKRRILRVASMFTLVLVLFSAVPVKKAYAWGPNTHVWVAKKALERAGDSPITRIVKANLDAFYCGLIMPDIAVIYYYTNFESYKSTHSWSFLREISKLARTDDEKAFVHGVACHLIQDAYAHNYFIPRKIAATQLQNAFIHPLAEAAVETHHLTPETTGSMTYVDKYLWMVNQATGRNWTYEANFLKAAVAGGRFYQDAYTVPESDPLWNFYKALAGFVSRFVDVRDSEADLELAVQKTVEYLENGVTPPLDPSGSAALAEADAKLTMTTWILRIAFTGVTALVLYRFVYRKRRKKK